MMINKLIKTLDVTKRKLKHDKKAFVGQPFCKEIIAEYDGRIRSVEDITFEVKRLQKRQYEIVETLKAYKFTDEQGHPLENCVEFLELIGVAGGEIDEKI